MSDEVAIQQTLNRYSEGASRRDWDQAVATFVPDGIWEVPAVGARHQGHAAIREAMGGLVSSFAYMVQINAPAVITVDGNKAKARTMIREFGKFANRPQSLEILGIYSDELARTPEGWKFIRRSLDVLGMHNFALLPELSLT